MCDEKCDSWASVFSHFGTVCVCEVSSHIYQGNSQHTVSLVSLSIIVLKSQSRVCSEHNSSSPGDQKLHFTAYWKVLMPPPFPSSLGNLCYVFILLPLYWCLISKCYPQILHNYIVSNFPVAWISSQLVCTSKCSVISFPSTSRSIMHCIGNFCVKLISQSCPQQSYVYWNTGHRFLITLHFSRCVVGLERDKFDNKTVTFEEHIKEEHNMWHYLFFIVLVKVKDSTEYTGPESYVAEMIKVEHPALHIKKHQLAVGSGIR